MQAYSEDNTGIHGKLVFSNKFLLLSFWAILMKKDKEFHMVCLFCMLAYCEKSLWTYKASILCIASLCLGIGKKA